MMQLRMDSEPPSITYHVPASICKPVSISHHEKPTYTVQDRPIDQVVVDHHATHNSIRSRRATEPIGASARLCDIQPRSAELGKSDEANQPWKQDGLRCLHLCQVHLAAYDTKIW